MPGIPPETRVLVDARWLGLGGAGRATEYLLRGLRDLQPPGQWILWGGPVLHEYTWPGAVVRLTGYSPKWKSSQLAIPFMPRHDVALYMHQVRPLRPGRSVTLFHDTIQLRYGSGRWKQPVKRASHRLVARLSTAIVTVSEYSRATITRDLGLDPTRLGVVRYPVDTQFVERVSALRETLPAEDRILYVGQFAQHKNLERLIAAFGKTSFAAKGGQLLLAGGDAEWQAPLRRVATLAAPGAHVDIEGRVPQGRLDALYATSRVLAIPSLEEGFGLPAWEALCLGMPVCASTAGSLPEVTGGRAALCDPYSVPDIARALDEAASRPWGEGIGGSTMADFAGELVGQIEGVLRP